MVVREVVLVGAVPPILKAQLRSIFCVEVFFTDRLYW
jgi:hypothetical protein